MTGGNPAGAFNPKVVFAMLLFGAAAFFGALYFIGSGQTGGDTNNGNAHGASKGLAGYAAMVAYLENEGHEVALTRNRAALDDYGLLVITPPQGADAEEISELLRDRTYIGPTLIVVPKWNTFRMPAVLGGEPKAGWVQLFGTSAPEWPSALEDNFDLEITHNATEQSFDPSKPTKGPKALWTGMGAEGALPTIDNLYTSDSRLIPLLVDDEDGSLAGYLDDGGYYPDLNEWAGIAYDPDAAIDDSRYPVVWVVEPDLMNNFGFAETGNAQTMHELIDLISQDGDMPITFDLTLNGLGAQQNLLTLAFTPPFLAATLCLILAMMVVTWRAFRRFGPPVAEDRAIAFGKARLVKNSAGFIQRSKRMHLLSGPYAAMTQSRIAKLLGLKKAEPEDIDLALSRREPTAPSFTESAAKLREAKSPNDVLRAAAALKSIERMLSK